MNILSMNKIKEEKKFQCLDTSQKNTPAKIKVHPVNKEKETGSNKKHVEESWKRSQQYAKKQILLASTLEEKQKGMGKCFEFIDHLMTENKSLRKRKRSMEETKSKQKMCRYKTDSSSQKYERSTSYHKDNEHLKKQIRDVKAQRDKLFSLINRLEIQNDKLYKQKQQSKASYSQIINSFKKQYPHTQRVKEVKQDTISVNPQHLTNLTTAVKSQFRLSNHKQFSTPVKSKQRQNDKYNSPQTLLKVREEKQVLSQRNKELELLYRKAIKNYQELLNKYQKQVLKNDKLRDEKDELIFRYKEQQQKQLSKKSLLSSQSKEIIDLNTKIKDNQNQFLKRQENLLSKFQQLEFEKKSTQRMYRQLETTFRLLEESNRHDKQKHNKTISQLRLQMHQSQKLIESLKLENAVNNQQISQLTKDINLFTQHKTHSSSKESFYEKKDTQQKGTQTEPPNYAHKSIQKNDADVLNEQDLLTQIIEKDMYIDTLTLQNSKLQQIIIQHKQKINKQSSDPGLNLVKYKIENDRLHESIFEKDLRIFQLEKSIKMQGFQKNIQLSSP